MIDTKPSDTGAVKLVTELQGCPLGQSPAASQYKGLLGGQGELETNKPAACFVGNACE